MKFTTTWTDEQDKELFRFYPKGSTKDLVNLLGKSYFSIRSRANYLGLKRIGIGSRINIKIRFEDYLIPEPNSGCWLWVGNTIKGGYGHVWAGGKPYLAHRISWELHNGHIPENMDVLHKCDVPPCVNPCHLFLGTNQDNMDDMVKKQRQTFGEKNHSAKLTESDVVKIMNSPNRIIDIARFFHVSHGTISNIKHGRKWKHITNPSTESRCKP